MHKKQSDSVSYLRREGSHATKGSRGGYTGMEHGLDFVTAENPVEARSRLQAERLDIERKIERVKQKMFARLSAEEIRPLKAEKHSLGVRVAEICRIQKAIKGTLEGQRGISDSFPVMFYQVAKHMLPYDLVADLVKHTQEALAQWAEYQSEEMKKSVAMQKTLENLPESEQLKRWQKRYGKG